LLDRGAEDEILPLAAKHGLGLLAYGVLAQGLLTGKYGAEARFGQTDRRNRLPHFSDGGLKRSLSVVARLRRVAERVDRSPAQVAIRWALQHPAVHCAIVGAKKASQVDENVEALGWRIPEEDRRYLREQEGAGMS
jgi:aryl-alcohol dehydrogenase-like predicted oxidoreductase